MTQFFSALMVRIFSGGIVCAVAMMLAGDGAKKEIVRLCCACLMIILILTPINGADFSLDSILESKSDVEEEISRGMEEVKQQEYTTIAGQLCRWVEEQAAANGIGCTATLDYSVDEENLFTITKVTVKGELDDSQQVILTGLITQNLGVNRDQVIFVQ